MSVINTITEIRRFVRGPEVKPGTHHARVIAIAARKGGVGKTTTTVNLAAGLALNHGRRVLLIDMDAQGHVAMSIRDDAADTRGGDTLSNVLLQKRRDAERRIARDSGVQFLGAAAFTAVFAAAFETQTIHWTAEFLFALSWMIFALSLGAISILYFLIRRGAVARLSSLFFLVPGVTAAMAWAMFGETYGPLEFAGLVVAAIGVALVVQPFRAST